MATKKPRKKRSLVAGWPANKVLYRDPKIGPHLLLPLEPSVIGEDKIRAAVAAVKAERPKKLKKTS